MAAAYTPTTDETMQVAADAVAFINASPSAFHATASARKALLAAGFSELDEAAAWELAPGGKYFMTRNQSALVAWAVGGAFVPGNGLSMVGAHTDSPCLKIKPASHVAKEGFLTVGVEVYGGPILHSWFDRDLGLAGRVVVRSPDGALASHLVHVDRPLLRVPTLAIHLERSVNTGFSFNKETELLPILGSAIASTLGGDDASHDIEADGPTASVILGHSSVLLSLLVDALADAPGCAALTPDAIVDFDLVLADVQPGTLAGAANEYIFASQLDNLMMSFCSVTALTSSLDSLDAEPNVRLVALFDNEEVGSQSEHGANSSLLHRLVARIIADLNTASPSPDPAPATLYDRSMRSSFFVSADMAHAAHPNYGTKHPPTSRPKLNAGPVIKYNANERYATTGVSAAILKQVAADAGVPIQVFACRNDIPCGSTIGPMTSAKLGVRTVDMGNPQLSMHSIREMCGSHDPILAVRLFAHFFAAFPSIDASFSSHFPDA